MQRDIEGHEHWHELIKGQYNQGLVAQEDQERRGYIVTITQEANRDIKGVSALYYSLLLL